MPSAAGFSLIEVLISLLLISLILLGLDVTDVYVLHQNKDSWSMMVAANQIKSMIERISVCNSEKEVVDQVAQWRQENKKLFMHGHISQSLSDYTITICWDSLQTKSACLQEKIPR